MNPSPPRARPTEVQEYDRDATSAHIIAFVDRKEREPPCKHCGHASLAHNGACYHEECWDMLGGPFKCTSYEPDDRAIAQAEGT